MSDNIYSVSQLNSAARQMLEGNFSQIWLTGEISNFTQPVSGHWYLTLKDENAQVRCAMFRMKNLRVAFRPQNGMQVLVRANVRYMSLVVIISLLLTPCIQLVKVCCNSNLKH